MKIIYYIIIKVFSCKKKNLKSSICKKVILFAISKRIDRNECLVKKNYFAHI